VQILGLLAEAAEIIDGDIFVQVFALAIFLSEIKGRFFDGLKPHLRQTEISLAVV
jgi:hypothetical protein